MKVLLLLLLAVISQTSVAAQSAAQVFDSIWSCQKNFAAAQKLAKEQGKPLCLIITRSWCGACTHLKTDVLNNRGVLQRFANSFIFVNIDKEGDPVDSIQHRNTGYFPRIYFYGPNGEFLDHIRSASDEYIFFYGSANEIAASMNKVLSSSNNNNALQTSAVGDFESIWKCQKNFAEAQILAKQQGKPLCLIITRPWCSACNQLKADVRNNRGLLQGFADSVVFVNIDKEGDPVDNIQHRGSSYFPRIYFYGPNGEFLDNVRSTNDEYIFYYGSANELAGSIRNALSRQQPNSLNMNSINQFSSSAAFKNNNFNYLGYY